MKNPIAAFGKEVRNNIKKQSRNRKLRRLAYEFLAESAKNRYSYNFSWLGRPIIQYPQDIVAAQELIWSVKPDLIIETGIAHGGSIMLSASILELIGGKGRVVGIDIDIRKHNRRAIEAHRMMKRITMIEGSSTSPEVINKVRRIVKGKKKVMVFLDSNHTHEHVLHELELYSPLVTKGSYLVVWDTVIKNLPDSLHADRPWDHGHNPGTAVEKFLKGNKKFAIDRDIENKLLITVAPGGFLKRVG